jgi:hypothetical protein
MTRRLEDLPTAQQDAIRRDVAQAPPLTDRQRQRLELLFRAREGGRR